jgi:molybdopterin-guanine dinucleotide biosynthesis protein A
MGRAKSDLLVGDATLLDWIVGRLGPAFAETIVVGARAPRGARAVRDRRTDAGPLAGIEAALLEARSGHVFVLACDMPRASERLAALLLERCQGRDVAVPRIAGLAQPTCAAYARPAGDKITAFLDSGGRRATRALEGLDAAYLEEPELVRAGIGPTELTDLDTPADYEAFIAALRA